MSRHLNRFGYYSYVNLVCHRGKCGPILGRASLLLSEEPFLSGGHAGSVASSDAASGTTTGACSDQRPVDRLRLQHCAEQQLSRCHSGAAAAACAAMGEQLVCEFSDARHALLARLDVRSRSKSELLAIVRAVHVHQQSLKRRSLGQRSPKAAPSSGTEGGLEGSRVADVVEVTSSATQPDRAPSSRTASLW